MTGSCVVHLAAHPRMCWGVGRSQTEGPLRTTRPEQSGWRTLRRGCNYVFLCARRVVCGAAEGQCTAGRSSGAQLSDRLTHH
ncbi:hypothetical protein E2C01_099064 [Portunus trituberculatus]|uniref:Uncharacterized protein n=1 Tax=Portunus trituberculatus TaxID=210409 RepID=A0A5B7K9B8_PORTR|nr:hypothetical protein [Portunus trituberculatus]